MFVLAPAQHAPHVAGGGDNDVVCGAPPSFDVGDPLGNAACVVGT